MKTKIYLLFITTLFFCAGCGNKSGGQKQESVSAAKDTYVNPLFPEGADPSALFHNGKYYYIYPKRIYDETYPELKTRSVTILNEGHMHIRKKKFEL